MPANSGLAFVVVLHFSPQHESQLAQILQSQTAMPVTQATESIAVQPNRVYVIPPNKNLAMVDGKIVLSELAHPYGRRVAIDLFFRTLADAYGNNSVCIVLSGTGSDGMLGLKRIKESHGFALVQDPDDAEYNSMPRSAIATNLVDWILPVAEMPQKLVALRQNSDSLDLADTDPKLLDATSRKDLRDLLTLVRLRTGHDFSNYKQPTLLRRIARHLQIHQLEGIDAYVELLHRHPEKMQSLIKNLLINVTNFFRDKEAFAALENQVIPQLFAGKTSKDTLRVWVAACASGEEAFSIGMLLTEYADQISDPPKLQIFATDVDEDAVAEGRQHRYPQTIEVDVSPERLQRFFNREGTHYRVCKELREIVLFAPHNLLRDPPFSKLDLVACRNLLIYLNSETQERVLQIFHFVLKPNGFLFLGNSESAENSALLFGTADKKQRIYIRRSIAGSLHRITPMLPIQGERQARTPSIVDNSEGVRPFSFGEVHHKLVEQYAPPSVLVNAAFEIVHLSESAGRYLRFASGEPSNHLFKVIHPALLPDLRAAMYASQRQGKTPEFPSIGLQIDGKEVFVKLSICQFDLPAVGSDFLLVIFNESPSTAPIANLSSRQPVKQGLQMLDKDQDKDEATQSLLSQLEEELRRSKEQLRTAHEQNETSNEEHKAANEELQAINEELRSASEELETSKEEMQSLNEELSIVNQELKEKIEELNHANSDLQNLMQSTDIGTLFLDRAMTIKRYTPSAQRLFNLIPSDVGRPLEHVTHRLNYETLLANASEVLRTLKPVEHEISDKDGRYYLARISPYRTLDDKIQGVVLTFVDINEHERKQGQDLQRRLVNSQEHERQRIARELHDSLGQQLFTLHLGLKSVQEKLGQENRNVSSDVVESIQQLRSLALRIDGSIDHLTFELIPLVLDDLGLEDALRAYLQEWSATSNVPVNLHMQGFKHKRLPPEIETTIYRIVQEALTNILKHAAASRVSLIIEQRRDQVLTILEDDGRGFDWEAIQNELTAHRQLGLQGMMERAKQVGGWVEIESVPETGTTLYIHIPLTAESSEPQ